MPSPCQGHPTPTATSSASTATRSLGGLSFRRKGHLAVTGPVGTISDTLGVDMPLPQPWILRPRVECPAFCCVVLGDKDDDFASREARHSKVNDTVWMATQAYLLLYNTAQVR